MKLLKPDWVSHEGKPIFSIDIHPDGSRFATGGQGDNSGKVVIWNMSPVVEEADEKDSSVPKMLCQMENHLACVNCVRWSNNGKYLSSAGDDKIIMIWQISRQSGVSTVFGSSKLVNAEPWRCTAVLRGHSGDVLDVAWSPHDAWLATCSIDNTIIIWNAFKFPEQLTILRGHTGLVKGVTWDPIGKYLASQSDDRSLRVWRTLDWQQETCITDPFKECGGTTHVLRLGWSPDGHYVVSAHAMNNSGPVAQIVERDGWKTAMDFVGHRKAVTCVRFNPNIICKKIKLKSEKVRQYSCCAIGSRDRSLSVWITALRRPLVVVHDLFSNSILDVSWNSLGDCVLACSWDGSVAYLSFEKEEIGTSLTKEETYRYHQSTYGKSLKTSSANMSNQIIETSTMLNHQEKALASANSSAQPITSGADTGSSESSHLKSSLNGQVTPVKNTSNKQIETRTQDGRRRITPIFLASQPDVGLDVPAPFTNKPTFSSSKDISHIIIEKTFDGFSPPNESQPLSSLQTAVNHSSLHLRVTSSSPTTSAVSTPTVSTTLATTAKSEQQEMVSCSVELSHTKQSSPITVTVDKPKPPSSGADPDPLFADSPTADREKIKFSLKRKFDSPTLSDGLHAKKKDGRGRPRKDKFIDSAKSSPQLAQNLSTPVLQTPEIVTRQESPKVDQLPLRLPIKKSERLSTFMISGSVGSDNAELLEIQNCVALSDGTTTVSRVTHIKDDSRTWEQLTSARITSVTANCQYVGIACEDKHVIFCATDSGIRLLPDLSLNSCVSEFCCNGPFMLVITSAASLFVWNLKNLSAMIKNVSLSSILSGKHTKLERCFLTESGSPIITVSSDISYTYHTEMGTWMVLNNTMDPIPSLSSHNFNLRRVPAEKTGVLASIQSEKQRSGSQAIKIFKSSLSVHQAATTTYLETQVSCSQSVKSREEFHHWLTVYFRYIVQEGMEMKVRSVCDDLLGPLFPSKASIWKSEILGLKKRSLLDELLPILASNLSLQRLFTEYREQLDSLES